MKPLLTHLVAFALGILTVVVWPARTDSRDAATTNEEPSKSGNGGITRPGPSAGPSARANTRPGDNQPIIETERELSKPIAGADLEMWLASKKGGSRSYGEALVVAGLITNDVDLIRQGIEIDPENGHLLFIGATLPVFSKEERFAMGARLLAADPENALAAFLHAAHLLDAGESDAAIQTLRGSTERHRMDDFRIATQLMSEDAYVAAGLSPDAAKFRSAFDRQLDYFTDLRSLATSLKAMETSMSPEEASALRSLTASMGQRLADQSRSGPLIHHLMGIALEKAALDGLPNDSPSPYDGFTVGQARESIYAERQELLQVSENVNLEDILSNDPALLSRYIDRLRLSGELEAMKWLAGATSSAR